MDYMEGSSKADQQFDELAFKMMEMLGEFCLDQNITMPHSIEVIAYPKRDKEGQLYMSLKANIYNAPKLKDPFVENILNQINEEQN